MLINDLLLIQRHLQKTSPLKNNAGRIYFNSLRERVEHKSACCVFHSIRLAGLNTDTILSRSNPQNKGKQEPQKAGQREGEPIFLPQNVAGW